MKKKNLYFSNANSTIVIYKFTERFDINTKSEKNFKNRKNE